MSLSRVSCHINAPRTAVYRVLLDPLAIAQWRVPDDMTCRVHDFNVREGGTFRVSLTYSSNAAGKTSGNTDTYHGHFVKLVPDELVVESVEFETADPSMQGQMTITTTLKDAGGGTDVLIAYDGLPSGISVTDNEAGTRMALEKLAVLAAKN